MKNSIIIIALAILITSFDEKNKDVRTDGMYCVVDAKLKQNDCITTDYYVFKAMKKIANRITECTLDSSAYSCNFYQQKRIRALNGTFYTVNDSVFACIPTLYSVRGMRVKIFTTYYRGYMKSSDTICDWKIIPPYPKVSSKFDGNFERDILPSTLYFIKNEAVECLDTLKE